MAKRPEPFNNPFRAAQDALEAQLKAQKKAAKAARAADAAPKPAPVPAAADRAPEPAALDAAELFTQHVGPVQRIHDVRGSVPPLRPEGAGPQVFAPEEEEAYEELVALVEGRTAFDIADSDEFIRGGVAGLDSRILRKLQRGEFAWRKHLDLHGMTKSDAKDAVEAFICAAREAQERCVLIVHGRGLNSKDKIPVLKEALRSWLARGRIGRGVLAFCSARPHDGGAGAMYVLLRR
jgi:DNA-nicking Smr family endonuclease